MPRAMTGNGPLTPVRTSDVEARKKWNQEQAKKTSAQIAANQWEEYERQWAERIRESDRREREEMESRIKADEAWLAEARARQETLQHQRTFELLLAGVFDGATADEKTRVTRLIEQKHGKNCRDLDIWEVTLRALRETLHGDNDGPDWRSGIREVQ